MTPTGTPASSMNGLIYLLEANISLMLFIGLYRFGFERLTFFEWNRAYLLGGLLISLVIPFVNFPTFDWSPIESAQTVSLLVTKAGTVSLRSSHPVIAFKAVTLADLGCATYWIIVSYHCLKLAIDIGSVIRLVYRNPRQKFGSVYLIWVPNPMPTSSFFHYLFLNKTQCQGEVMAVAITHEQVHSHQGHTVDWLLVRFISALFWFNPLMPYWRRAIATNHEYIADSQSVKTYDSLRYAHLLVSLAAQPGPISTLHYFSYGQLKSRIIMLHRLRSQAIQRMRFFLVVPLMGLILTLASCRESLKTGLVSPSLSPKGAYQFTGLIGTWTNTNRTTINANDGKTPRDFPERAGDVRACSSQLVLGADGRFQMVDERTGQNWLGTWQSDQFGISVQLHYYEAPSTTNTAPPVLYNRDGSEVKGPFPNTIHLDVTSLKGNTFQAWQSYPSSDPLSGGTIYYEYQKQ